MRPAPLRSQSESRQRAYEYLRGIEARRDQHELGRKLVRDGQQHLRKGGEVLD
jgi:hypothetical protein